MRRLVKHALAGAGFVALTATAGVAALGSPAERTTAIAVPVLVQGVDQAEDPAVAAERAINEARQSREAERVKIVAEASAQAVKRDTTLSKQSAAISKQQTKLKKAEAKAKAAAAKAKAEAEKAAAEAQAAKERAIRNNGYEPGTTDPREMAKQILANKFDYGPEQYDCFNYIIMRESMWKIDATNASSGAYGIPQALPGSKMASVASDWRTNPATQIIWAIGYMNDRYGSPCKAKSFKASHGWY